ncbi:MAG: ketoacyl-ACP synthase III [Bacteroidaceae bacterium]|nr:ketoacyl-ACP synthase III [Bacteroidaceae bacterium]
MAFFKVDNVNIAGIAACVPPKMVENMDSDLIEDKDELRKYIETTGVQRRYIAEDGICSSDLCLCAAEKLIAEIGWDKQDIECLILVTQTPDYIFPATACVLQNRLGLSTNCLSFDITMSCPGWIYGLSVMSSMLSAGRMKKGLLLVGETSTKAKSPYDRVNLLAGDAGTATLLEFKEGANPLYFSMHSDGSNFKSLIIPDGGYRNPTTKESFDYYMCKDGIQRNRLQSNMEGEDILSFAMHTAPKCIKGLLEHYEIPKEEIDYFLIHQANQMINKLIQKRLRVDDAHCPYNIADFGNTSSTTIPLMIVNKLQAEIGGKKVVACGFGTGLAWGAIATQLAEDVKVIDLVHYSSAE